MNRGCTIFLQLFVCNLRDKEWQYYQTFFNYILYRQHNTIQSSLNHPNQKDKKIFHLLRWLRLVPR